MTTILDGKKLSKKILRDLRENVKKSGKSLRLIAVSVSDDQASRIFLRQKEKACQEVGIDFKLHKFPSNISNDDLIEKVKEIVQDPNSDGIIIQLPLSNQINTQEVLNLIPPEKDIDVLSEKSLDVSILSPVLQGIIELIREYNIEIKGKNIVIVGKGRLVGKPVAAWMEKQGVEVLTVGALTPDISQVTKKADILICGVGKKGLIKGDMVKEGVIVIDAAGDVDFKSVFPKASFITPVPGGVGPMCVAAAIKNLIILNGKF